MNSVNINDYFKLGLDTDSEGIDTPALLNTFRTAPDNVNTLHNRVTFKVPKNGLLTQDSGVVIQCNLTSTANANVDNGLNIVNGILGCVKRSTVLIDSKPLIDLENPSYIETNKLYSRNNPARLLDFHKNLLGNSFITNENENNNVTNDSRGKEQLAHNECGVIPANNGVNRFFPQREQLQVVNAQNKRYFIPLHMLGCNFLRYNSLPVYLMKDRDIELQLEFDTNAGNWSFNSSTVAGMVASGAEVDLSECELVTTHVLLDEEVESEQRAMLQQEQVSYSLIESYLVKGVFTSTTVGTAGNDLYRLNLQNREVHKLLTCFRNLESENNGLNPLGNQASNSMGDEVYNYRINGQLVFDDDVSNDAVSFYLNALQNNGQSLKVSKTAWSHTTLDNYQVKNNVNPSGLCYRGKFHYLGLDCQNGNGGVFGSGTAMRTPLELIYQATPVSTANPKQNGKTVDVFFYVSASKLLKISSNNVVISF